MHGYVPPFPFFIDNVLPNSAQEKPPIWAGKKVFLRFPQLQVQLLLKLLDALFVNPALALIGLHSLPCHLQVLPRVHLVHQ
jgi:hypothetical protein